MTGKPAKGLDLRPGFSLGNVRSVWVVTVLLLLVDTNFWYRLTDLHLSKLSMTVLTVRDIPKFSCVNTAIGAVFLLHLSPDIIQITLKPRKVDPKRVHLDLSALRRLN